MDIDIEVILDSIAESIYEWDMAREGWESTRNFAEIGVELQNDYREIAKNIVDIIENFLDDEFVEDDDVIDDWEF